MAGAGVVGISETMIAEIRKSMAEVQAQCDAVLADGNALIKQLQDGSAKVEDTIRGFADLQAKVQLAFRQAGNDVATFTKGE